MRRSRVGPCVPERLEPCPGLGNLVQDVQQVAGRSCEPIKASNDQDVALGQIISVGRSTSCSPGRMRSECFPRSHRSSVWTATVTLGSTNEGRGVDLAIFAGIWDELLLSGAPECATIGVSRGRWWPVNQLSPPLRAREAGRRDAGQGARPSGFGLAKDNPSGKRRSRPRQSCDPPLWASVFLVGANWRTSS
jgi:hypothetical protein